MASDSSGTATVVVGSRDRSADAGGRCRPPRGPARTDSRSSGARGDRPSGRRRSVMSSAPASMATSMTWSSSPVERHGDDALALELPAHRAGLGHVAAVAGEEVADLGAGAVAVVGERLDDDGHAAGRVALVVDRLVADPLELAGAALDRPLDGVDGDRGVPGLLVHGPQGGVGGRGRRRPRGPPPRPGGCSLANTLARALSCAPLRYLVVAHFE